MKKLFKVTAASAAILAAAAITTGTASANQVQITGGVPAFCEITVGVTGNALVDFVAPTAGETRSVPLSYQCNDFDGSTVTMTSTEGGLESDDREDFEVEYTADLTLGATSLQLDTGVSTNVNDVSVSAAIAETQTSLTGNIVITMLSTAPYAGGYSDTLQVDVLAN